MRLLADSCWRAAAYCLHPRVILLSLVPLALMVAVSVGLSYFYWEPAVGWMRGALDAWPLLAGFWNWLQRLFVGDVRNLLAPLIVLLAATPVLAIVSLVVVAAFMAPALTRLVAERRFPTLEKKHGAGMVASVVRSVALTVAAVVALLVSMPLWLVPPLVLVLPPLIWGWLTCRVMSFDALAEHASADERRIIVRRHRLRLLTIGILCGYLGAAPSIVWASGLVFAAAFFILIPVAMWIYTLVFAFSALWFAHYALEALSQLRREAAGAGPSTLLPSAGSPPDVAPPALPSSDPPAP
ncbi:MAG: EI24 domain-containing protein [Gammaproteobacteria bacterium]|uniref:EI24 domain-containing protein n=1 Tax=Pseudacidovorax sp. TaxID=1934311 RepID=UPI001B71CB50|nr:EI24 domain-containing protein [Pseudacidovorax sp.]MBP6892813.1 EI24 domain-containing protein [Pseudacidovorax sp.]